MSICKAIQQFHHSVKNVSVILMASVMFISCIDHEQQQPSFEKTVDLNIGFRKDVSVYDFCSKVELVQIENVNEAFMTEIKIASFDKLGDTLYVLTKNPFSIKKLSTEGAYLGEISKYGRGHGEFIMANDICINHFNNTLEVLDPMGVIYKYDISHDYEYVGSIDFSKSVHAVHHFVPVGDNRYLLYRSVESQPLLLLDGNTASVSPLEYHEDESLHGTAFSLSSKPFMSDKGNSVYYSEALTGDLLHFNDSTGTLEPYAHLDYGKHNLDVSSIEAQKDVFAYHKLANRMSYKSPVSFIVCKNGHNLYESFRYRGLKNICSLVYDTSTDQYTLFEKTKEGVRFFPSVYVYDNVMYRFLDPEVLSVLVSRDILNDQKSVEVFDNVSEESNILLLKYTLK